MREAWGNRRFSCHQTGTELKGFCSFRGNIYLKLGFQFWASSVFWLPLKTFSGKHKWNTYPLFICLFTLTIAIYKHVRLTTTTCSPPLQFLVIFSSNVNVRCALQIMEIKLVDSACAQHKFVNCPESWYGSNLHLSHNGP